MTDYRAANQAMWDERAPAHAGSPDYAIEAFVADPEFLSHVVRFDRPRLGDLTGVRGLHLQCHIGTDTVSLARLGARMTGLDYSTAALEQARTLAQRLELDVDFVAADAYDAVEALGGQQFDLVFTGIGALCWLPDIARWAAVVDGLLRPGGRLFLREGHPMLWAVDEDRMDVLAVEYAYVEVAEPVGYDDGGTSYVQTDGGFHHRMSYTWNHGLGEIVTALLDRGLLLTQLVEHDSVPWEALPGRMVKDDVDEEWRLAERPERLPLTYTLQAVKPA